MHTFFLLLALLIAGLAAGCGSVLLRLVPAGGRRPLALGVLATPPLALAFAAYHVTPLFWMDCSPLAGWDRIATLTLLGAIAAVAAVALILNCARLVLIERLLSACPPLSTEDRPALLPTLTRRQEVALPDVRLLDADAPLAVAGGLWRPAVVLSTWLLEHLDPEELAAVFAHELVHVSRRDYLTRWAARVLRDATVYLPSAWYALAVVEMDEELHADAEAVKLTGRPLAMASALGKVWAGALTSPRPLVLAGLPNYAGNSQALLEERLSRLMDGKVEQKSSAMVRGLAGLGILSLSGLVPRLLLMGATALPLVCSVRPH